MNDLLLIAGLALICLGLLGLLLDGMWQWLWPDKPQPRWLRPLLFVGSFLGVVLSVLGARRPAQPEEPADMVPLPDLNANTGVQASSDRLNDQTDAAVRAAEEDIAGSTDGAVDAMGAAMFDPGASK